VTIDIRDGVADVRLNRPEKMNALDDAMFRGIIDAGLRLKDESGVRAVVLSGEGRAFCAGLDFSSFGAMAGDAGDSGSKPAEKAGKGEDGSRAARGLLSRTDSSANRAQLAPWIWQEIPVPVIAAIHGVAEGFKLEESLQRELIGSPNQIEAVKANLQKRQPNFSDPE
jgi:enoyl-CoA hydratase/carnithine racemase